MNASYDYLVSIQFMLEGKCKLEKFSFATLDNEMDKTMMKELFGVTIENVESPVRGRIYRTTDESVEVFHDFFLFLRK